MDQEMFVFPLSFSQERLWFLEQLEPGSPVRNVSEAFHLDGPLDVRALEDSLCEIVRRHEVLRTTFSEVDGRPVQLVGGAPKFRMVRIDLCNRPPGERESEGSRLIEEEVQRPFDLARGSPLRVTLLRLDSLRHILVFVLHHIVSDAWSLGVFQEELSYLYRSFTHGEPILLPALSIQYADYAAWQRESSYEQTLETQLSYWRDQLNGTAPALELRSDYPRPRVQTYRGSAQPLLIAEPLSRSLRELSRQQGATLFMTLLAAFDILLFRLTGQDDVVVGTPIAGRNRPEVEPLIGPFLNLLVLRTDLSGNPTFRDLLRRVRNTALDAYEHQDIPFERLLKELQPRRDPSRTPLFQILFNMIPNEHPSFGLSGLEVRRYEPDYVRSNFDLTAYVWEEGAEIEFSFVYNADLFSPQGMAVIVDQYQHLLQQIAGDPERWIDSYSLLTPASRQIVPDPALPLPVEWHGAIHDHFVARARLTPEHLAVVDAYEQWSYRDLDLWSNSLANYLLDNGIAAGDFIAIYGHRSAGLVWAMLGVLKAGAAFLILDPAYPPDRLIDYLRAALPRGWIQIQAAGRLPASIQAFLDSAPVCCQVSLPSQAEALSLHLLDSYPTDDPGLPVGPDDLACVAFTSGSTGTPKAVLGRHGPLTHFLPWQQQAFAIGEADRFSMLSALSHDPLQRDIFTPLWTGATLCVPDDDTIGIPGRLAQWMAREGITFAHLTPAMSQILTENASPGAQLPALRHAFFVGDQLTQHDVQRLTNLAPNVTCTNSYGSTETQRAVGYFTIPPQTAQHRAKAVYPLGSGMPGAQLLVLTGRQTLAGIGELGEIHLRSPHLARGYLGDEALTRQRFLTNPFTGLEHDRLYRTGDLGRYLPNGDVEFAGRNDQQVKIRGFRIELGEIEAVLRQHDSLQDAAVLAWEDQPGQRRLVAYVVPANQQAPASADLRSHLSDRLPDYMIPSVFVTLDALPLTPNRKVDRRVLPAPDWSKPELTEAFVAPQTPVEDMVAGIWADVLKVERVGIHDNFFELGGHSLLATRVMSRLHAALGVELSLRTLFENQTIAGLATAVKNARQGAPGWTAKIPKRAELERAPLSFAQERMWFLDQLEPGSPARKISLSLRFEGPLDVTALEECLTEVIRRHEVLRTAFSETDGKPVQVIAPATSVDLPLIDLLDHPAPERPAIAQQVVDEIARQPFDLAQGPLLSATLIRLDNNEHLLFLRLHHIIFDGWSVAILRRELSLLYEAFSSGKPSPLPELPIQYADYAIWQRNRLQQGELDEQLSYWMQQLEGAPPTSELPADHPRPPVQTYRGAYQYLQLSEDLTRALKGLCRRETATLFMTLMAAFKAQVSRLAGQDDIVFGTPIAGRNHRDLEGLVGCFLNSLILRTDLSGDPTFLDLLRRVRETALAAYDHQDVPFEKLLEELQPARDLSRTPFFQIFFNMLNLEGSPLAESVFGYSDITPSGVPSNFDLTVYVRELGDQVGIGLVYNADLFDGSRIEEMLVQYRHLLEQIAENPEQTVTSYSLVAPAAKERLPDPRRPLSAEWKGSIQQKFSERAQQTPDHLSVVDEHEPWTYLELESWSNRLANLLRDRGIQPQDIVAIYGHRSATLVLAILGVLKVGGAFLVLDPAYPPARLIDYLSTAQPAGWIHLEAAGELPEAVREYLATSSLDCQVALAGWGDARLDPLLGSISASDPGVTVGPDDPACVVFTSGSTGQPKAVLGRHGSLTHFLTWRQELCHLTPADHFAMLSGLAYSPLQRDIFTPLSLGATIYIPSPETIGTPGQLARWMLLHEISFATLTPAMAQILTETDPDFRLPSLRNVFLLGDKLTRDNVNRLRRLAPGVTCTNSYGSTESQRAEGFYVVPPDDGQDNPKAVYPVGQGMPDVQLLVLNAAGQMTGVGELGEIYIRSPHVALGYLGDEALTRARFLDNPFTLEDGDRLYRMGDLGRYLPDGTVEMVGRADRQVKIRGFRIEPGEIEAALHSLETIQDAVVLARDDQSEQKRLVAYVVPARQPAPARADLRGFLSSRLPDYMVPSAFVMLDALPLTPNGKVDLGALPAPDWSKPELAEAFVAPRTPIEEILAGIWADVLKVERIGIHDDFFELGGHSLLATRVVSQMRTILSEEVPLRAIFEAPTIAELSQTIIAREKHPGHVEKMAGLLQRIKDMPPEEKERMLRLMREGKRTE